MSLQGSLIVVAENPATDLVEALGVAGAFPIVEAKWTDAPTAYVAVKPAAVIIAEPGAPPSETAARMLCLQIATANGPIVPVIARVSHGQDPAVPVALPIDAAQPVERLIARLNAALRVRALHGTVLRRIEMYASHDGKLPELPVGDALEDATVLIAGRGPLYPALSTAIGERMGMLGALSVENAARHLTERDIDGIVIGDGFSQRMVDAFLTVLVQDARFRDIPVALIGEAPRDLADHLTNIDQVDREPRRVVARITPLVRMHALEARLKRMLKTLDGEGMYDPDTGLLTRESFWRDFAKVVSEASDRGHALSAARFSFDGEIERRVSLDGARLVTRLIRNIDFACREPDGSIVVAFTHTDLQDAHVVARRIASMLKNTMIAPHREHAKITVNVTLATLKARDTMETLTARVMGSQPVAAEKMTA